MKVVKGTLGKDPAMSTAFHFDSTGEWAFTRWCGPRTGDFKSSATFEFGTAERMAQVLDAVVLDGLTLVNEDDDHPLTGCELLELLEGHRCSFGEFGGTVELGSGEAFDRMGFGS